MKSLILLASLSAIACGAASDCAETFQDGSDACDSPVLASELDGTWCNADQTVCLTTTLSPATYTWNNETCLEAGHLSGGLEFTPDYRSGRCFGLTSDLYSASVDWTDTGIRVFLDGQPEPLDLNYLDL
jgi:hypothetical protein